MMGTAVIAVLIAGWNLMQAFHPRWRRLEFRFAPISGAVLLLLFAALLVMVVCAMSVVARYVIWLPLAAVVGLTIQHLAHEYDDRRNRASTSVATSTQPVTESQKNTPASARTLTRTPYLLWA